MQFLPESSQLLRVTTTNNSRLTLLNQQAPKNGYAYIYLCNESDLPVYFDNLAIAFNRGNLIEEDHYYPYGQIMAGISSRKIPSPYEWDIKNNYLYNDKPFFDEAGLNIGDYALRNYDPQIGRWWQADPYNQFPSPYTGIGNNPINLIDPSGGIALFGLASAGLDHVLSGAFLGIAAGGLAGGLIGGDIRSAGLGMLGGGIAGALAGLGYTNPILAASTAVNAGAAAVGMVNSAAANNSIYHFASYNQKTQLRYAIIDVTNEIVGEQTIKDYPHDKGRRYKTPLYKVVVSGMDESGNIISKDFKAIRFGVKTSENGSRKVVALAPGKYTIEDFLPTYYGNTGAFHIVGNYLIHLNSITGPDGNNGCIAIAGGRGMWKRFKDYISQLTSSSDLSNAAKKGQIKLKIQYVTPPKLF